MPSNIEKFSTPEPMKRRQIEEGISDYIEEKKDSEIAIEIAKKANEAIDLFYSEGLERGTKKPNFPIKEKLASLPNDLRIAVFKEWLLRDPGEFLWQMDEFEQLPSQFQKDIAEYLASNESPGDWVIHHILKVFNKITDRDLHTWIINNESTGFSTLAKYKSKLPYISDEEILKRVFNNTGNYNGWINWAAIVPYIDKFPSLDKDKVIEGVLKQYTNSYPEVLIENRDKIGLSERQLIDLFYKHKKGYKLAANLKYIEAGFHQEIADKCIEEGNSWVILQNAGNFQNVDVPTLLRKIANVSTSSGKRKETGLSMIERELHNVAGFWGEQVPQDIVDQLIDKNPAGIAGQADKFGEKIDKDKLIGILFNKKEFETLVAVSEKLGIERNTSFADRIIEEGGAGIILTNIDKFLKLPRETYIRLLEINPEKTPTLITRFEGITKDDVYSSIRSLPLNSYVIGEIIKQSNAFDGLLLDKEFADLLMENSHFSVLVNNLDKFEGLNVVDLARRIMDSGDVSLVIQNLTKFSGLNHQEIADTAIEKGEGKVLIQYFKSLKGLNHREIVLKLLQAGESYAVAKNFNLFEGIADDRSIGERLFKDCLATDTWDVPVLINISETYKPHFDKTFALTYDIFGEHLTKGAYSTIREIRDDTISSESLRSLGIAKSGEAGLNQLRERMTRFKSEILESSFDAKILLDFGFYAQYYKACVRFTDSEWGEHDERSFDEIVYTFSKLQDDGKLRPLPTEYQPSGEIRVNKVNKESQESFQYSEQFLSRYETLRQSLEDATDLLQEKKPLSHLLGKVEAKRDKVLTDLQEKLQQLINPKALENLHQRIGKLKALDLRSIKDFQDNFSVLAQFGEFHNELRQLTFYYALHKHKNYQETARHLTQQISPLFGDVSSMINFVGHIVNQETWDQYFTNKQAVKSFDNLISIRALEEEFARAQNQSSKGTTALEFVPTRGLLMEFSGHIADACWASKYKSIAKEFPNFSTMIIVQNKSTKHERLAGATMMIETESKDGSPLLVIRGLNPVENVINSLSVEDFFEKFTTYAREIAEKAGRQLAIVVDDHSGGSGTNRPTLFSYLEKKKRTMQKITLKSETDTKFNGYNIVDNTYLI